MAQIHSKHFSIYFYLFRYKSNIFRFFPLYFLIFSLSCSNHFHFSFLPIKRHFHSILIVLNSVLLYFVYIHLFLSLVSLTFISMFAFSIYFWYPLQYLFSSDPLCFSVILWQGGGGYDFSLVINKHKKDDMGWGFSFSCVYC